MDKKYCSKCKRTLNIENFCAHNKRGVQVWCRECQKEYDANHYQENKDRIKARNKEGKIRRRDIARNNIANYLDKHPCVDCGETDHDILTFDHVRGTKEFNISDAVKDGMKWERVSKEIKKCKVRCFNCHMKRTAKQRRKAAKKKSKKK